MIVQSTFVWANYLLPNSPYCNVWFIFGARLKEKIEVDHFPQEHNDLTESFERVRQHLDEETKFHQEQTSQNAAVMAEMQDTINQLKEQLADALLGRSPSSGVSWLV